MSIYIIKAKIIEYRHANLLQLPFSFSFQISSKNWKTYNSSGYRGIHNCSAEYNVYTYI